MTSKRGVNDAPALKKADIGDHYVITWVAREAADIVLQDDAFSTIVVAVEQDRVIFGNIRKFVFYLLSCPTNGGVELNCSKMRCFKTSTHGPIY